MTRYISFLVFIFFLGLFLTDCKWDLDEIDFPLIETHDVDFKAATSVVFSGEITKLDSLIADGHGFVWSQSTDEPTIKDNGGFKNKGPTGNKESFEYEVTGLEKSEIYHVRAFLLYLGKEIYGNTISFSTHDVQIYTTEIIYEGGRSMQVEGSITWLDAGAGATQYGLCWSTNDPDPSLTSNTGFSDLGQPTQNGAFFSEIEDLEDGKTYSIRSYMIINGGQDTVYGEVLSHPVDLYDVWDFVGPFPGVDFRFGISFVLNDIAYVGLGQGVNVDKRLWRFNLDTEDWDEIMEDYPGEPGTRGGVSFVIGDTAYVGLGKEGSPIGQFYKFTNSTWADELSDPFPGETRQNGVGFSYGDKGYAGLGRSANFSLTDEIYSYDPQTGKWDEDPINDFPDGGVPSPMYFRIDNVVYFAGGDVQNRRVFALNLDTGTWEQKNDFPGGYLSSGMGFSVNGKGYIGMGKQGGFNLTNNFWQYDPVEDFWIRKASPPARPQLRTNTFVLDGKAYLVGRIQPDSFEVGVWVYKPE